ncbi:hypothetical protein EVAR_86769_1 [Eumeta japonica]|uniref:Uncharacterized protein n=1 Tax=Eumeta variegata TaxID=151549 RepID=A0A4C1W396_EUMVA|nr:hypothetical protein EVAR_86769_1 [Eumeta japonica]
MRKKKKEWTLADDRKRKNKDTCEDISKIELHILKKKCVAPWEAWLRWLHLPAGARRGSAPSAAAARDRPSTRREASVPETCTTLDHFKNSCTCFRFRPSLEIDAVFELNTARERLPLAGDRSDKLVECFRKGLRRLPHWRVAILKTKWENSLLFFHDAKAVTTMALISAAVLLPQFLLSVKMGNATVPSWFKI